MPDRLPDFDSDRQASFLEEEAAESRRFLPGQVIRWALAFALLFAAVFFFFWWSGHAVRFSAARVADRSVPTWRVIGAVRDATTGEPVPWAVVTDDASGRPPWFRADADQRGEFELMTLAEPHRLTVQAAGYRPGGVQVGRQWFVWWPSGEERVTISLQRE